VEINSSNALFSEIELVRESIAQSGANTILDAAKYLLGLGNQQFHPHVKSLLNCSDDTNISSK